MPKPNRAERRAHRGRLLVVQVDHQGDCPAGDRALDRLGWWQP